jgi:hypothetical protein
MSITDFPRSVYFPFMYWRKDVFAALNLTVPAVRETAPGTCIVYSRQSIRHHVTICVPSFVRRPGRRRCKLQQY